MRLKFHVRPEVAKLQSKILFSIKFVFLFFPFTHFTLFSAMELKQLSKSIRIFLFKMCVWSQFSSIQWNGKRNWEKLWNLEAKRGGLDPVENNTRNQMPQSVCKLCNLIGAHEQTESRNTENKCDYLHFILFVSAKLVVYNISRLSYLL